jgi:hypothetical protein
VGPSAGCRDEGEIRTIMNAGEVSTKERIWISRMEYYVLKEKMKENECGWSYTRAFSYGLFYDYFW